MLEKGATVDVTDEDDDGDKDEAQVQTTAAGTGDRFSLCAHYW